MTDTLVKVDKVSKKFCSDLKRSLWYGMQDIGRELIGKTHGGNGQLRPDEFWAIKELCFELQRGECIALIGPNGAGKTTFLRMLNGLIKPDLGRIEMRGRVGALIALGAGFNPLLSGRENIYVNAAILGFTKKETDQIFDEIVEFAGLAEFIDAPVQHYSSGMYVRLGFSIAANFQPDILLVDEALAVGDNAFVIRCLNRIADLRNSGTGVIFVSHNELQVRETAQKCVLLSNGVGIHFDNVDLGFHAYDAIQPEYRGLSPRKEDHYDAPIEIASIKIDSNTSTGKPAVNEDLIITLQYFSKKSFSRARFELRFWNSAEQLVSTIGLDKTYNPLNIPSGPSTIKIEVKNIPLRPGRYRLAGGFRCDGAVLAWSRCLSYIDITDPQEKWAGAGSVILKANIEGPISSVT